MGRSSPTATQPLLAGQPSSSTYVAASSPAQSPTAAQLPSYITDAYKAFENRINDTHRGPWKKLPAITSAADFERQLEMVPGNTTHAAMDIRRLFACICLPFYMPYYASLTTLEIPDGEFAFVTDTSGSRDKTIILGPGYHVLSRYYKVQEGMDHLSFNKPYPDNRIVSKLEDVELVTVNQGEIAHYTFNSQHIIFSPGVYKINPSLVVFQAKHSLDSFQIKIGPETWVTIPEGYAGIAIDSNQGNRILEPGGQRRLEHVGVKFSKLVPLKLQNDFLAEVIVDQHSQRVAAQSSQRQGNQPYDPTRYVRMTTGDGSEIIMDVMLSWRIKNVEVAARDIMKLVQTDGANGTRQAHIDAAENNISHLRKIILQIAKGCLAEEVGKHSLTGDRSLAANVGANKAPPQPSAPPQHVDDESMCFQMLTAIQGHQKAIVQAINEKVSQYGLEIVEVNIYNIVPPEDIRKELNQQTQARVSAHTTEVLAEAQQRKLEIDARSKAAALKIQAESEAQALEIQTRSQADAKLQLAEAEARAIERVATARAQEAAQLSSSSVATELERLRVFGDAAAKMTGSNATIVNPGDSMHALFASLSQALVQPSASALPQPNG